MDDVFISHSSETPEMMLFFNEKAEAERPKPFQGSSRETVVSWILTCWRPLMPPGMLSGSSISLRINKLALITRWGQKVIALVWDAIFTITAHPEQPASSESMALIFYFVSKSFALFSLPPWLLSFHPPFLSLNEKGKDNKTLLIWER